MFDIVFPNKNEEEFLGVALKLGTREICFVYDLDFFEKNKDILKDIIVLQDKYKTIKIFHGINCKIDKISKAKKYSGFVFVENDENNRDLFERKKIFVYNIENLSKSDFLHHRNSGINQVMCSLAKENDITVCFSFNSLLFSKGNSRGVLLGRLNQNLSLCRKYKVDIVVASFARRPFELRSLNDLKSLFL